MPLPEVSQKYKNREARNRSQGAQRKREAQRKRQTTWADGTAKTPAQQLAKKFSEFAHRGKLTKDLGQGNYQNTKTGQGFTLNAAGDHVYADGRTVKVGKSYRPRVRPDSAERRTHAQQIVQARRAKKRPFR